MSDSKAAWRFASSQCSVVWQEKSKPMTFIKKIEPAGSSKHASAGARLVSPARASHCLLVTPPTHAAAPAKTTTMLTREERASGSLGFTTRAPYRVVARDRLPSRNSGRAEGDSAPLERRAEPSRAVYSADARQQQLCGVKRGFSAEASSRAARRADHLSDASSEAARFREGRRLRTSVRALHCVHT